MNRENPSRFLKRSVFSGGVLSSLKLGWNYATMLELSFRPQILKYSGILEKILILCRGKCHKKKI
jgi:hypothetical protein